MGKKASSSGLCLLKLWHWYNRGIRSDSVSLAAPFSLSMLFQDSKCSLSEIGCPKYFTALWTGVEVEMTVLGLLIASDRNPIQIDLGKEGLYGSCNCRGLVSGMTGSRISFFSLQGYRSWWPYIIKRWFPICSKFNKSPKADAHWLWLVSLSHMSIPAPITKIRDKAGWLIFF